MDCCLPGSSVHRILQAKNTGMGCHFLLQGTRARDGTQVFSTGGWILYHWATKETLQSILSSIQLLSHVWLFVTPWTAAHQASLSTTNSQSLLKLMSIESVMPSNRLIFCCPFSSCLQSFPSSGSFPMSQFFTSGDQSIGALPLASVLPMNIQDWFPLGLTDWISLQSKGLSRVFSNTTV